MKTRGVQGEGEGNKAQGNQARREMDSQRKNGTYMANEADIPRKCQGHEGGVEWHGRDRTRTSWET